MQCCSNKYNNNNYQKKKNSLVWLSSFVVFFNLGVEDILKINIPLFQSNFKNYIQHFFFIFISFQFSSTTHTIFYLRVKVYDDMVQYLFICILMHVYLVLRTKNRQVLNVGHDGIHSTLFHLFQSNLYYLCLCHLFYFFLYVAVVNSDKFVPLYEIGMIWCII